MDGTSTSRSSAEGAAISLVDVLSIPTVLEVVLKSQHVKKATLRQTCSAICCVVSAVHAMSALGLSQELLDLGLKLAWGLHMQVDRHIESLCLQFRIHQDIKIADTLAKKQLQPRQLSLICHDNSSPPTLQALTGLVSGGQHHHLLKDVKALTLNCGLSKGFLQV
jgi:hypothetical protein